MSAQPTTSQFQTAGNIGNSPAFDSALHQLLISAGFIDLDAENLAREFTYHPDFLKGLDQVARVMADLETPGANLPACDPWIAIYTQLRTYTDHYKGFEEALKLFPPSAQLAISGVVLVRMDQLQQQQANQKIKNTSQANQIIDLARKSAVFFHSPGGQEYARIAYRDGHYEIKSLHSKNFRSWLSMIYYESHKTSPSNRGIEDALNTLCGLALYEGPEVPVFIRVGEYQGNIYIDIGDNKWSAVEISPAGWKIIQDCPVAFFRPRGALPLPVPRYGGSLEELWKCIHIANNDRVLLLAWLLGAFSPRGPYPVLALYGEQGSAKSMLTRFIRMLVDPNESLLRAEPRDIRDLMIGAKNNWVLALDNISTIVDWLSDGLCRTATGGGYGTRMLWSDDEEIVLEAKRPVIINGVTEMVTRPDLMERTMILDLPPIPDDERKTEASLWREFESVAPDVLGGLFDLLGSILRELPSTKLDKLPRMADFALWVTAAEPALGLPTGFIAQAYRDNQARAERSILDEDPLVSALERLLVVSPGGKWGGTATSLLSTLTGVDIKTPHGLSGAMRRLVPSLRRNKISIQWKRNMTGRSLVIERLP